MQPQCLVGSLGPHDYFAHLLEKLKLFFDKMSTSHFYFLLSQFLLSPMILSLLFFIFLPTFFCLAASSH